MDVTGDSSCLLFSRIVFMRTAWCRLFFPCRAFLCRPHAHVAAILQYSILGRTIHHQISSVTPSRLFRFLLTCGIGNFSSKLLGFFVYYCLLYCTLLIRRLMRVVFFFFLLNTYREKIRRRQHHLLPLVAPIDTCHVPCISRLVNIGICDMYMYITMYHTYEFFVFVFVPFNVLRFPSPSYS